MAQRNDGLYEQIIEQITQQDGFRDIARMMDVDRWTPPEEEGEGDPFQSTQPPSHEIVPIYDEGYDALIVTCATDSEWGRLRTLLELPEIPDRKHKVGATHVITYSEFEAKWRTSR